MTRGGPNECPAKSQIPLAYPSLRGPSLAGKEGVLAH